MRKHNYPNLRTTASVYRILAWVQLVMCIGFAVVLLVDAVSANLNPLFILLCLVIGAIIMGIIWLACYTTSELIELMINIEYNTADTRDYLEDIRDLLVSKNRDTSSQQSYITNPTGKTINELYKQ